MPSVQCSMDKVVEHHAERVADFYKKCTCDDTCDEVEWRVTRWSIKVVR